MIFNKNQFFSTTTIPIILLFCSCSSYYLQHFDSKMLAKPNRIHIENGNKQGYAELGFSYSRSLKADTVKLSTRNYYDFEKRAVDSSKINEHLYFPTQSFSFYAARLGTRFFSGQTELAFAKIDNELFYDFSAGIGFRFFDDMFAGRTFLNFGMMNTSNDVFIFRKDNSSEVTTVQDSDLIDKYSSTNPYIEWTFTLNTKYKRSPVNPFLSLSVKNSNLFKYDDMTIDLAEYTGSTGLYVTAGLVTGLIGVQWKYCTGEKFDHSSPNLVTQLTISPAVR
jgi:hypothetical protein